MGYPQELTFWSRGPQRAGTFRWWPGEGTQGTSLAMLHWAPHFTTARRSRARCKDQQDLAPFPRKSASGISKVFPSLPQIPGISNSKWQWLSRTPAGPCWQCLVTTFSLPPVPGCFVKGHCLAKSMPNYQRATQIMGSFPSQSASTKAKSCLCT